MRFPLHNSNAIYKTFRSIELFLVLLTVGMAWLSGSYKISPSMSWQLNGFLFLFALLSLWNPYDKSIFHKRLYIFCNMSLFVIGTFLLLPLDVQFYWAIIKACFLLSLQDVIIVLVIVVSANIGITYFRYPSIAAMSRSTGFSVPESPNPVILGTLSYYIGSSVFCIILSIILLSERQSRMRAENLSKEVETLSASLERSRIARDIHDSLGHLLTTLDIHLEVAQKLRDRDLNQSTDALDTAKQLSTQCLREVRNAVQSIRGTEFDLNQSLTTLVERMSPTLQILTDCRFPALPLQMSHQIYCIVQEALTNVQKHAQATQVSLCGYADEQAIILSIEDNGIGFEIHAPRLGFGLRGIEERAQIMGGQLTLNSEPGVCLQVRIPWSTAHYDCSL
jgi:signal transduction histidine kinase